MINGIDHKQFLQEFLQTDIGKQVQQDFDVVECARGYSSLWEIKRRAELTFREIFGRKDYLVNGPTSISITTLYYLQFLLQNNPKNIYDIGCGWNIWKRYYPQIVGIDYNSKHADIHEKFNDEFIERNLEKFDAAMSVNMYTGLMQDETGCVPVTFENYIDQIKYFAQVIKPGGRCYVGLHKISFLRETPAKWFRDNNVHPRDYQKLEQLLLECVKKDFPYRILCFDCEFDTLDSLTFDGCVRLVFEK